MNNGYCYIDPDYTYTDPKTGVLRNLGGIEDHDALTFAETAATTKRVNELREKPIPISEAKVLFSTHYHLFQDIYKWAGQRRTVEISKDGKQFFPLSYFDNALGFINIQLTEYKAISSKDILRLSQKLAEILDTINFLHPFREGNGRTQREFIRLLASEKGLTLNLNPPDDAEVYERYMTGTVNGDVEILAKLIYERLSE